QWLCRTRENHRHGRIWPPGQLDPLRLRRTARLRPGSAAPVSFHRLNLAGDFRMSVRDIIAEGLAGGWSAIDAATADLQPVYEADVVVIGTGAGGGTTAEILTQAGLRVIMVEEGTLPSLRDFKMDELSAYPLLYQEAMSRTTLDGAIAIMQAASCAAPPRSTGLPVSARPPRPCSTGPKFTSSRDSPPKPCSPGSRIGRSA